jgi:uncharacterized protein (TIGR02145 family)
MKNSEMFRIFLLVISVVLFTAGCEKESGLPVDSDGNVYDTVVIGTQVWLKENLKTTRYNNGVKIPLVTDNAQWASMTSAAYCWYNNNPVYKENYGALYNWYVVNTGLLCPAGWHVPSKEEWETLINYVKYDAKKLNDIKFWACPNYYTTNESGFSARLGGWRSENGTFLEIERSGYWWSSSLWWNENYAWCINIWDINISSYDFSSYVKPWFKVAGFSVRCIKNN